jgi:predicted HicB family RNase H-like nuclease
MVFKVQRDKDEYVNRTFRFKKDLIDRMDAIAQREDISLNSLTVQCIEFALSQMENTENSESKK